MALRHAEPGDVIHLGSVSTKSGVTGTAALVKSDRFEAIHLLIPAGAAIPSHHVSGYVTLYCLEGRVILGPSNIELRPGDWIYLERGDHHSLEAIEDVRMLLTILFDTPRGAN